MQELTKMFNDSDSFYYSPTGDLTNTIQRQHEREYPEDTPLWMKADDRFFWNKFMMNDLISTKVDSHTINMYIARARAKPTLAVMSSGLNAWSSIIQRGYQIQVFSLILDVSTGLWVGIQSAEEWVPEIPGFESLPFIARQLVSISLVCYRVISRHCASKVKCVEYGLCIFS